MRVESVIKQLYAKLPNESMCFKLVVVVLHWPTAHLIPFEMQRHSLSEAPLANRKSLVNEANRNPRLDSSHTVSFAALIAVLALILLIQ